MKVIKTRKKTTSKTFFNFKNNYNYGQNILDKFTKLNRIGVSMEEFTADF